MQPPTTVTVMGLAGRVRFFLMARESASDRVHDCAISADIPLEAVPVSSNASRSLSEKQCSKRYASLVECKDANYSTTKSRLL